LDKLDPEMPLREFIAQLPSQRSRHPESEVFAVSAEHVALNFRLLYGVDAREAIQTLPARSVQTCCTSLPYFGFRDYGSEPVRWEDG